MRSKEEGAQGVENVEEIVIVNLENDESSAVEYDVQSEMLLAELGFFTNPTYKAQIGMGLTETVLHLNTYPVDTRARPNGIDEDI